MYNLGSDALEVALEKNILYGPLPLDPEAVGDEISGPAC
jgi:hypothetical protein